MWEGEISGRGVCVYIYIRGVVAFHVVGEKEEPPWCERHKTLKKNLEEEVQEKSFSC